MGKRRKRKSLIGRALAALLIMSSTAYLAPVAGTISYAEETQKISLLNKYDSSDTAAIKYVDTEAKTITFRNHDTGRDYTLNYDNTSYIYDAYGRSITAALLEQGAVANITFLKSSKHLNFLQIDGDAWTISETTNYDLNTGYDQVARIGNDNYGLSAQTLLLAEGKQAIVQDILPGDTITAWGIGDDIYSITVTKGHGYVSLSSTNVGESSLSGAWLEVGNTAIHRVTEHMLVDAPEGDYDVHILGKGADYTKEITIHRDMETVVDTGEIEIEAPSTGTVTFQTIPLDATVYVDGQSVLTDVPITLDYGFHTLAAEAEGYVSISKYLKVGQSSAVVQIRLEESPEETEEDADTDSSVEDTSASNESASDVSGNTASSDSSTSKSSNVYKNKASTSASSASKSSTTTEEEDDISNYKVYIDGPSDTEVYLDSVYIGIAPTYFTKVSGNHTITLKKTGYQTKSYSISIDTALCDKTYSFPELVAEEDVSDNSTDSTEEETDTDEEDESDASDTASTEDSSGNDSSASTEETSEDASDDASTVTEDASDASASEDEVDDEGKDDSTSSGSEDASTETSTDSGNASSEESTTSDDSSAGSAASADDT